MEITLNFQSCGPRPALSPAAKAGVDRRPAITRTASVVNARLFMKEPPTWGIPIAGRSYRTPLGRQAATASFAKSFTPFALDSYEVSGGLGDAQDLCLPTN